jgi:hypothetical protein
MEYDAINRWPSRRDHFKLFPPDGIWPRGRKRDNKMDRPKNSASFQERLSAFVEDERRKASQLPPGAEREISLRKIRQAETASHLDDWASSPGSQPSK